MLAENATDSDWRQHHHAFWYDELKWEVTFSMGQKLRDYTMSQDIMARVQLGSSIRARRAPFDEPEEDGSSEDESSVSIDRVYQLLFAVRHGKGVSGMAAEVKTNFRKPNRPLTRTTDQGEAVFKILAQPCDARQPSQTEVETGTTERRYHERWSEQGYLTEAGNTDYLFVTMRIQRLAPSVEENDDETKGWFPETAQGAMESGIWM